MCPFWLLVAAVVVGVVTGATDECCENVRCQELTPESIITPEPLYSMSHFRWGKPVKQNQCFTKIYTMSAGLFSREIKRRDLSREITGNEDEEKVAQEEMEQNREDVHKNKDNAYKMKHFRWSSPLLNKRYGGFTKISHESAWKPLMTLFRNVIGKTDEYYRKK